METWLALAGVLSGAVVGLAGIASAFFAPAWLQRTSERRTDAREFRTAQRLVARELLTLGGDLFAIGEAHTAFAPDLAGLFVGREWEIHKTVLARLLPDDVWVYVRDTYSGIHKLTVSLTADAGQPHRTVHTEAISDLRIYAKLAHDNLAAAKPIVG